MLTGRGRALLTSAVLATAPVLLADGEPAAVGNPRPACPPTNATKVFGRDKYGAVYRQRYDGPSLRSCSRDGKVFHDPGFDDGTQDESIAIGGRFYAYASGVCDTDNPCLTNIVVNPLGGYRLRTAGTPPSTRPVSDQVYVTRLRIAANQALAWIVCEGGGSFGPTPPACLRDGHRRWLYVRPASDAFPGIDPTLIATGQHIDPRFLKLSPDGTKVTWRQQRKLHAKIIGR